MNFFDPASVDFFTQEYCAVMFAYVEAIQFVPVHPDADDLRDQMLTAYPRWINNHVVRCKAPHLAVSENCFSRLEH